MHGPAGDPLQIYADRFSGHYGIGSGAMHADSRQTDFCAYLSAVLLGGLLLNAGFGWWWAVLWRDS
jgi:hypothetical protein